MELYRGNRLSVERRTFKFPDGKERERIVIHPGDAVAVLPMRGDGSCHIIRQYRFAINDNIYEAPAGTIDAGETPEQTARRELIEETGLQAETFIPRGYILPSPGYTDERIYLFEAHGLTPSCEFCRDEDEDIEVVRVLLRDLYAMIDDGRICDAKTICLVYRCLRE